MALECNFPPGWFEMGKRFFPSYNHNKAGFEVAKEKLTIRDHDSVSVSMFY